MSETPDNVVPITKEEPEDPKLTCGMCLIPKAPETMVPVCAVCAGKLESYVKHVLGAMNEIVKLLYPKANVNQ